MDVSVDDIKQQRDELLEALRQAEALLSAASIYYLSKGSPDYHNGSILAREAIAKVEQPDLINDAQTNGVKVSLSNFRYFAKQVMELSKPAAAVSADLGNGLIALVGSKEDIRTLLESEDDKPE